MIVVYHHPVTPVPGAVAACGRRIVNTMLATHDRSRVTCVRCLKALREHLHTVACIVPDENGQRLTSEHGYSCTGSTEQEPTYG